MQAKPILLLLFSSAITISSFAAPKPTLLPPWVLLQRQISTALNADECVHVSNLIEQGQYKEIKIRVCDMKKAQALAAFVNEKYDFGNIMVMVTVTNADGMRVNAQIPQDPEEVASLFTAALTGNKYFVKSGTNAAENSGATFAEFKPLIIQYWSDNIHDWYLNNNEAASEVFAKIMKFDPFSQNDVRTYATTSLIK